MERLTPVVFPSAGSHPVQLEGLLHRVEGAGQWPAAVVCHPHPLGGGAMHNAVVSAISRALVARGVMALRFNFRGVGRSGGQHDYGRGEQADLAGALDWLLAQPEVDPWRVSVAGYSFGAWVGLLQAQADARVTAVAAVGLAAWHYDEPFYQTRQIPDLGTDAWPFDPDFLQGVRRPKLFVSGEQDAFAPPQALRCFVEGLPPPKMLRLLPGADHFFVGHEREVGNLVVDFLGNPESWLVDRDVCQTDTGRNLL